MGYDLRYLNYFAVKFQSMTDFICKKYPITPQISLWAYTGKEATFKLIFSWMSVTIQAHGLITNFRTFETQFSGLY